MGQKKFTTTNRPRRIILADDHQVYGRGCILLEAEPDMEIIAEVMGAR
jgi:hypothetical protein